jgi:DNA end-binding protein Ku
MAPRAYWKGYVKLSLVSCPVALFPATSEREKISFHQLNKNTGNRIKYRKVDAETGDEVEASDIIKGYQVGKGEYLQLEPEELEAIAIESKRTIESMSLFRARKLTNFIKIIRITSCLMGKSGSKRLR